MTGRSSRKTPFVHVDRDSVNGPASGERPQRRVIVLGIGNVLLSDEGVGVHVIRALAPRYAEADNVEVIDGGTSGMDLLPLIEGAKHLIVIDAIRFGLPPASIVRLQGEQVPAYFRTRVSPHQFGLSDLLAALAFLGASPTHVVLIGVQPVALSVGLKLSFDVQERLEEVVSMIEAELESIEHSAGR